MQVEKLNAQGWQARAEPGTIQEVTDAEYVSSYVEAFDRAVDIALEPRDTAIYLKLLSERLE